MKKNKELRISKSSLAIAKGFSIVLFAILVIFSPGTFFKFLSQGIIAGFGFIGFWILMPLVALYGFYVAFKKHVKKFRFDIALAGLFIIVAFVSILATNYIIQSYDFSPFNVATTTTIHLDGTTKTIVDSLTGESKEVTGYLTMDSSFHYLGQVINDTANGINTANFAFNIYLAGGFFGFVFDGIFNSLFSGTTGTTILSICFILIGILLVLNRQIKALYVMIRDRDRSVKGRSDRKVSEFIEDDEDDYEYHSHAVEDDEENAPTVEPARAEPQKISLGSFDNMSFNSFNSGNSLKRPSLNLTNMAAAPVNKEPVHENTYKEEKEATTYPYMKEEEPDNSLKEARLSSPDSLVPDFLASLSKAAQKEPVEEEKEAEIVDDSYHMNEATRVVQEANEEPQMTYNDVLANQPKEVKVVQPAPQPTLAKPVIEKPLTQEEIKVKRPYVLPSSSILEYHEKEEDKDANKEFCETRINDMNAIFSDLGLGAQIVGYTVGPSVTRYDLLMDSNRSVSTIDRFIPDLQIRLGGIPIRFEKLVVGKSTSGLEMENKIRTTVGLRECIDALDPLSDSTKRQIIFGKGIDGSIIKADLTKFPHMLIAGTTGSGKSVFVQSILVTLLTRNTPEDLKLLLIDPKRVELAFYRNIPHLLCPSVSDSRKAYVALKKLVDEMEKRYTLFSDNMVNEIKSFNKIAESRGLKKLPYIVVVIDEYADLNDECKEVREPVSRLAQKARSAGIHLIVATQRPSVNVIDGVIKANISTRVALCVSSQEDSRVIIGESGAEKLLSNGDLLIDSPVVARAYKPRVQGCYVSEEEIIKLTDAIRAQRGPEFVPEFLNLEEDEPDNSQFEDAEPTKVDKEMQEEELYTIVKEDVMNKEYCSISFIQRSYGVGFPKAGRLFARLVREGIVSKDTDSSHGSKVLVHNQPKGENLGSIEQSTLVLSEDNNDNE